MNNKKQNIMLTLTLLLVFGRPHTIGRVLQQLQEIRASLLSTIHLQLLSSLWRLIKAVSFSRSRIRREIYQRRSEYREEDSCECVSENSVH